MPTEKLKTISLCQAVMESTAHILMAAHEALDYDDFSDEGKERLDMIQIQYRGILSEIQGVSYYVSDMEEDLTEADEKEVEDFAILIEDLINSDIIFRGAK